MTATAAANAHFEVRVTPEVLHYSKTAPLGSAVGRARAFGVDVDALVIKLATTTALERLSALDRRILEVRALRRGMR